MLQAIRDQAKGWIAWVIVILISIPFALWGIQEYLGVGAEPVVATVNGEDILERDLDRRARDFRENLRANLGASYRPDLFAEAQLRQQVRESMINERVLLDTAENWGLRAGDELVRSFIQSIPSFQRDDRFSQGLYETALRNRGMSPAMFEQGIRQDIVLNQIRQAVRNSGIATQREIAETARLQRQERDVSYISIAAKQFLPTDTADEDELRAFYERTATQYMAPEKLSLQYLLLAVDELAKTVMVDEEKLQAYFDQHAYEFRVPEQRKIRHILIDLPQGVSADVAAKALEKVQTARERLVAGEDFAKVAKLFSDDPGSAQNGGDLGFVERGVMAAPFEEAAFALELGVVSEPVLTQFGYHLIEVTDIMSGGDVQLGDVRGEVEKAVRRVEAENLFYDYAERLGDLSFENPGSLAPAAEELSLQIQTTEPFARAAPPPALQHPKALNAAFSEEVLVRGNNSDLLDLGPNQAMVLRVLDHQEAHLKPFAEVRQQVEEAYRTSTANEAARKAGEGLLAQLKGDQTLEGLAEQKGWKVEKLTGLKRDATSAPPELVKQAFLLRPPDDSNQIRYGTAQLPDSYVVLRIDKVINGEVNALSDEERRLVENRVRTDTTSSDFDRLIATLRESADISVLP
jgi:peptidyl-prolyl cis-trans isomerase D